MAGCGTQKLPTTNPAPRPNVRVQHIYPTARGTEAAGGPSPNGILWVLSGTSSIQALYPLLLTHGTVGTGIPVVGMARTVALVPSGPLVLGLGIGKTGALEWINPSHPASTITTTPLPGPVVDVVSGSSGRHLYVLWMVGSDEMCGVVSVQHHSVKDEWPVTANTVSLSPGPNGSHVYTLTSSGQVTEWTIATHTALSQFSIGHSGIGVVIDPSGTDLYVLKGQGVVRNIAVVSVATESVLRVIPAPAASRQLVMGLDGRELYVVVGTKTYGNVQTIAGFAGGTSG